MIDLVSWIVALGLAVALVWERRTVRAVRAMKRDAAAWPKNGEER